MPNPKILIIEDESVTALAIKHKLERLGYSVLATESCGSGAIEKTLTLKPDLILMDIILKGEIDGIEAAAEINKKLNIPIVYLTAYSNDETLERAKLTRPYGYINKPFSDGDLKSVIETALYKYEFESKSKENQENLSAFLNSINEIAFLIDLDGNIEYTNEYTENIFGNVFNDNIYNISHPEKAEFIRKFIKKTIETGKIVIFEDENKEIFTEIRIYPILNKNREVSRLSIFGVDISDRKKIEQTLRESEKKYRQIVETANEGIWVMDDKFKTTFVNEKMAEMLGYTTKEMINKPVTSFMFTEDLEDHNLKIEFKQNKISEGYERRFKHKNGSEIWTVISVTTLKGKDNDFAGSIAMFTDITKHKKAQKDLKYSENKFRELFNNMSSGAAVYEAKDNCSDFIFKDFNNTAGKIENVKKEDVIGKSVLELFPGIKDFGLYDVMQRVWKTGIPEYFPASFYKDQRITGWKENYVYKLPSGEIVAVYNDVTEQKKAEKSLKESERKFREVFNKANDMISLNVIDNNGFPGNFIEINDVGVERLGYSKEELLNMGPKDIASFEKPGEMQGNINKLYEKGHKTFETIHVTKNGKKIPVEVNNHLIKYNGQKVCLAVSRDITERENIAKILKESEAKYRSIFENSMDAILLKDHDGNILDVNPAAKELYGYSKDEFLKLNQKDIFDIEDPTLNEYLKEKALNKEYQGKLSFIKDDGSKFFSEVTSKVFKDFEGDDKGIIIARDIREREKAEITIKENEEYMKTILSTIQTGIVVIDAQTKEIIDVNRAAIDLIGASKDEIVGKICHEFICPSENGQCPITDLNQEIDNSEKILLTSNGEEIPIIKSVVPITLKERDCLLDSFIDIRELKKLEKSLKESKERYKALVKASPEAVIVTDIKGNINFVSPKIIELCGFEKKEEFVGKSAFEFIAPECHKKAESEMKTVLEKGLQNNLEYKFIKADGTSFIGEMNLSLIKDDKGNITSIICTLRDVTEIKKAKNNLIESEAKYRNLYSSMNEGVALHKIVYDANGVPTNYILLDVNHSFEEIIGLKKENIIGQNATEVYNISDPPYIDIYSKVANSGIPNSFETYFEPLDKYFSISVFSPKKGEFATVFDDITQRKKAENALKESEAYYKTIFENTGTATIIVEEDTTVSLMNTESEKLCGYSQEEMEGKMSWKEFVKADFIPKMEEYHHQRRINPNLAPRNYEFKLVNKNKEIKYVMATVAIIPGTKKSLISLLDITSQKTSRKELRESEKKYRQLVENAHEGIWAIDLDTITTFVNPRMAEMLGYTTEEIIGKSIFSFIDEKYIEITKDLKNPKRAFKGQYDIEFVRKDNNKIYASIETSPILNDEGVSIGILAMVSDITDRKKAEEKIKESNIYHRGLIEASLDPLVTIGPDGKITDVNSTTEAITGHSRKELIGTDFSEYFTDPQKAREVYQHVFQEGIVKDYELEIKNKNGELTPVSYNASIYKDENEHVIGVFAAARDITERKNAEKSIKTSLKEKEVLLREIHHRVKNNLQIISSLLSLQSNYIDDNESYEIFTESQNRVKSMAMIHEKLYKSESISKIDFGDYVNDLTEKLFYNYKISPNMIKLNKKFDNVFFDINTAIPCGLIINELVTNCLKHAFPWFKSPKLLKESSENLEFGKYKIDIELKEDGENYVLTVADNGVGFPDEINFKETDSLGLQLVNNLVEQLDGSINLEKTDGTKFTIIFTENNYEERI